MLLAWFRRLNVESQFKVSDFTFDDPSSTKKVRGTPAALPLLPRRRPLSVRTLTTHPLQVPAPSIFSEPAKSLSVVIPAFNEEDRLPAALAEALAYLGRRRDAAGPLFTYEVIIVDDGSSDGTARSVSQRRQRGGGAGGGAGASS